MLVGAIQKAGFTEKGKLKKHLLVIHPALIYMMG